MTTREATQYLHERLVSLYGEGEASAMARWILDHFLGQARFQREQALSQEQASRLKEITERLMQHEPLQYILGEAWFCGMRFQVDPNVLIPRPETEELVEWVISNCRFPIDKLSVLDIGSGSGCIPVSLKRRIRRAEVCSIDVSPGALTVARRNADTLGTPVEFRELDFLDKGNWPSLPAFDIIISNPPYVPESDKASMQPQVLQHEPHTALFVPDNDPLCFYRAIAAFGKEHLLPGGLLFLEIHEQLGGAVTGLLEKEGYDVELKKDMQEKDRLIKAGLHRSQ